MEGSKNLILSTGRPGQSAYSLALELGFEGTEAEWLESLRAQPGPAGATETDFSLAVGSLTLTGSVTGTTTPSLIETSQGKYTLSLGNQVKWFNVSANETALSSDPATLGELEISLLGGAKDFDWGTCKARNTGEYIDNQTRSLGCRQRDNDGNSVITLTGYSTFTSNGFIQPFR